ncbi:MAG: DUF3833 family protein, partial [Candidatus Thiodiazotropha sp.]
APTARRVSSIASRLPGTTSLRFAFPGWQRWTLKRLPGGRYTGTADDVEGSASGQVSGNALHWTYTLSLPVGEKVYAVDFDDWMYLQEDGVLINRSVMKKFGFRLGEVTLFFQRSTQ